MIKVKNVEGLKGINLTRVTYNIIILKLWMPYFILFILFTLAMRLLDGIRKLQIE